MINIMAEFATHHIVRLATKAQVSLIGYSEIQIATAKEAWDFWTSKGASPVQAACLLGNEDGECSFLWTAGGDKVNGVPTAFSIFQWHLPRIEDMAAKPPNGAGIDVRTCSHADALKAAYWEMTTHGIYKRVWTNLMACKDVAPGITVLVQQYERSASQARDVARRTVLANYWLKQFGPAPDATS